MIQLLLNYLVSLLYGEKGVYVPFARDCSILIIAASVIVFLVLRNLISNLHTSICGLRKLLVYIYLKGQ